MSKELENLKELEMWATNGYKACEVEEAKELVKPIEKSLKALEIIKNKPALIKVLLEEADRGTFVSFRTPEKPCGITYAITDEEYELLKETLND